MISDTRPPAIGHEPSTISAPMPHHSDSVPGTHHLDTARKSLWSLARDTFDLWSHKRVGFSWRNYYLEHTIRVRNLCLALAEREDADADALDIAAILHDITKRFDGPFLTGPDGRRVVDRTGFWLSEPLLPDRGEDNVVTRLYGFLDEYGRPHSESGADITRIVLLLAGLPEDFAQKASEIVRAHVQPSDGGNDLTVEQQILCDADMLDSNLGLVAFYRNVQIHIHRRIEETGSADLRAYVEYVPGWLGSKDAFLSRIHTDTARTLAGERLARCHEYHGLMVVELDDYDVCERFGLLGVFSYFISTVADPDFFKELRHLEVERLPRLRSEIDSLPHSSRARASAALADAERFCRELRGEANGEM